MKSSNIKKKGEKKSKMFTLQEILMAYKIGKVDLKEATMLIENNEEFKNHETK